MAYADIAPEAPGVITITTSYEERDTVKETGARFDLKRKLWTLPLSWASCITLRGVFGEKLVIGEQLKTWAWDRYKTWVEPGMRLRGAQDDEEWKSLAGWLYPPQRGAAAFLDQQVTALLGSEMGTGKTPTSIAVLDHWSTTFLLEQVKIAVTWEKALLEDPLPALVVTTNTMKRVWKSELEKFAPDLMPVVLEGTKPHRLKALEQIQNGEADVAIVNWEALRTMSRLAAYGGTRLTEKERTPGELNAIPWRTVIADEAHHAKDPKAKQTRALWAIASDSRYRIAMTGTPIANRIDDLWSVLHFLDPKTWPSKVKFIERYALVVVNYYDGVAVPEVTGLKPDRKEEFYKVFDPMFRRDLKETMWPHMPEKLPPQVRYAQMTPKQAKAYKQMSKTMVAEVDGGLVLATNPLTRAVRLSQFAAAFATVNEDDEVELSMPSCKVDALLELLDEMGGPKSEESLVVFAESKQLINLAAAALVKEGYSVGLITGDIGEVERGVNIDDFQDGRIKVMLMNAAGAEGVTLTRAHTFCYLQRSWSNVMNRQAVDRVHRYGQTKPVVIFDIVTEGTIEEKRLLALGDKEDRLQEVVRDKELLIELLS